MVSGLAGQLPACRSHPGMPCPIPTITRPGYSPATVANSIAAKAGLRAAAGRMPIPTVIVDVAPSTATAWAIPPARKQSSTTHNVSNPRSSARRA